MRGGRDNEAPKTRWSRPEVSLFLFFLLSLSCGGVSRHSPPSIHPSTSGDCVWEESNEEGWHGSSKRRAESFVVEIRAVQNRQRGSIRNFVDSRLSISNPFTDFLYRKLCGVSTFFLLFFLFTISCEYFLLFFFSGGGGSLCCAAIVEGT